MTVDVSPADIDSLLDLGGTINEDRADLLITMAINECLSWVDPVPDAASNVVMNAAARAYLNPDGVQAETVGPNTVQYGSSMVGVYLTKSEQTTLKRLAGRGGAFGIDTLPTGVNCIQTVAIVATGGTFKLALTGQSTTALAFNATSAQVAAALGALSLIGAGNVTVSGNGPYIVTFVNALATTPVPTMTADGSALTGPAPLATVVTTTPGVYAPGQGLAPWDIDYFGNNPLIGGGGGIA